MTRPGYICDNYLTPCYLDEIEIVNGTCCEPSPSGGCSPIFSELAEILMEEEHIEKPKTPDEALAVYADLLRMIETIEAG